MGIAEILAKKKAESARLEAEKNAVPIDLNNPLQAMGLELPIQRIEPKDSPLAQMVTDDTTSKTPAEKTEEKKEETKVVETLPAVTTPPAKETFAERMARLRKEKELSTAANPTVTASVVSQAISILEERKETPQVDLTPAQKEVLDGLEDQESAQAYTDVCIRINSLQYAADGEDLENAMAQLTASLKKNPSACLLLHDPDIGQMVIYLRKIVGEEMTKEKEPAKRGRKPPVKLEKGDIAQQLAIPVDF